MAEQILNDLHYLLPEVILTATLLIAIITDLITRRAAITAGVVVAGLLTALGFVIGRWGVNVSIFSNMYAVDPFAAFFNLVILTSAVLIVVFSQWSSELKSRPRPMGEFFSLIVGLTLGMVLMAGANNLLMMYIALELSSISSYILSGYTREAADSSEASLKYVIYGSFSSGMMIYGISILYGLTGSLDLTMINHELPAIVARGGSGVYALAIAGILTLAGFGYKISAVPFHFWTPDVYEGAPITITAFLSVASKAGGFAMMIRFFKVTFIDTAVTTLPAGAWASLSGFPWYQLVAALSILTMTVGNVVALWQTNMKRMLAYSSIAHAGYLLMGVVVMNNQGLAAVLVYFVVYLFMNLGAFYVVMLIADRIGSEDMEDYKGLGPRAPFVTVALSIFLISLTGIPPTAGFIGKLYLFGAALNDGWVWLALIAALNSVIALYYYVRVMKNMYLEKSEVTTAVTFSAPQKAVVLVLVVPVLLLGIYFTPLSDLAQACVRIVGTP
ncbi:MAG TPA: NADH-quinone oxidoreductase subunit N [Bacteroidota bacterium]|nr:NADH-quinone oxidoreductase subunit N [Bacteroidota bacterium]